MSVHLLILIASKMQTPLSVKLTVHCMKSPLWGRETLSTLLNLNISGASQSGIELNSV